MRRAIVCALVALLAALSAAPASAQINPPPQAAGEFKTIPGEAVGNVLLTQLQSGEVYVSVAVKNMPPGTRSIHLHERGDCTPPFTNAGEHFNPTGREHGLENPNGPHAGDLPNIEIMPNGMGTLEARNNRITITASPTTILDADGSAIIIHSNADDQRTDPDGNSGERIACAVLKAVPVPQPLEVPANAGASAALQNAAGQPVGNVTMTQNADGSVHVVAQVQGMPAGPHGIHVHQFGACAPTFGAAGEHNNPDNHQHGLENPAGPHAADMPNIEVGADGNGTLDVNTTAFTLTPGPRSVFDSDGAAVIVHQNPDDYRTDPGGNSGPRLACGVVQLTAAAQPAPAAPSAPQPAPTAAPAGGAPPIPASLPNTSAASPFWSGLGVLGLALLTGGVFLLRRRR